MADAALRARLAVTAVAVAVAVLAGAARAAVDDAGVELPPPDVLARTDRRARVPDAKKYPFSAIGQFVYTGCTGALVGPRHVLTAAHCLNNDTLADIFVPAYNPWANWTQQAFGYAWVDHYRTPPDWNFDLANLTNFHDDYGLVTLLEPFGKPPLDPRTGYFQLDVLRNKSAILRAKGKPLFTAGYPIDKLDGAMYRQNCTDVGTDFKDGTVDINCWVGYGQSGSPVWRAPVVTGVGANRTEVASVFAVLSNGDYNSTSLILIEEPVSSQILTWRAEDALSRL